MSVGFLSLGTAAAAAWGYLAYSELEKVRRHQVARRLKRQEQLPGWVSLGTRIRRLIQDGASIPLRIIIAFLALSLALMLHGNVVVAITAGVAGFALPMMLKNWVRAREYQKAGDQVMIYLSTVLMTYITDGNLSHAAEGAAARLADPLGGWLRERIALVMVRAGVSTGEELYKLGQERKMRPLMRLGAIIRRAEAGMPFQETLDSLEDLDQEIREDERLGRRQVLAAQQGQMAIQGGGALLLLFYLGLVVMGFERPLSSPFGILATTASLALYGVAYLIARATSASILGAKKPSRKRRGRAQA